jgi:Ca2+-binding EF-hand superfamily protein
MNRFVSAAAVFALVLGVTTTARADDEKKKKKNQGPDLSALFAKLDTNNDKKLSKEEFSKFTGLAEQKAVKAGKEPKGLASARNEWFKKLDTNNDGFLSAEEFAKIKDAIAASPAKKKKAK